MSSAARLRLRRGGSLFDRVHTELFGGGEQGIYMPSVHESFLRGDLYQDAAGTTPVTAAGQSVGLWLDRSGNGNHASQPTASARPKLQQDANGMYVLRFDGVDDWFQLPQLVSPPRGASVALAGIRTSRGEAHLQTVFCFSQIAAGQSVGALGTRGVGGGVYMAYERDSSDDSPGTNHLISAQSIPAGASAVISGGYDGTDIQFVRANQTTTQESRGVIGEATRETFSAIGLRGWAGAGGGCFQGDIYGLTAVGAQKSLAQIELAENLINFYTRAY